MEYTNTGKNAANCPTTPPVEGASANATKQDAGDSQGGPGRRDSAVEMKSQLPNEPSEPAQAGSSLAHGHCRTQSMSKREMRMEELYIIGGEDPLTPRPALPISPTMREEIKYLYINEYAKGIDKFFETDWYSTKGLTHLMSNRSLCEMFASMTDLFTSTHSEQYDTMRKLPATEARMVWGLMCMPRDALLSQPQQPLPKTADSYTSIISTNLELQRVLNRLSIFEHLMTGACLSLNPHGSVPVSSDSRYREEQFWRSLGQFVTLHTSPQESARPSSSHTTSAAEVPLRQVRKLLDQLEGRDVLYSVAVVRHVGFRLIGFPTFNETVLAYLSEAEAQKLLVAKSYLEDMASGEGTCQVVQRVSAMAVRSWSLLR